MNSFRLTTWLLSGLCLITGASCNKKTAEPAEPMITVSYAQTYCADKWGGANGTQQLESVAKTYLAAQGIAADQLHASVKTQAALCNACTCTTGLVLAGSVRQADLPALQALGFTKQ